MGCCNTCSRRAAPPVCAFGPQQPTSQKTPLTTQTGPKLRRDRNTPVRPIKKKPFQGRTLYAPATSRDGRPIFYDSDIEEEEVPGLLLEYEEQQVRDFTTQVSKWKKLVRHARRLRKSQRLFNLHSEICKGISPTFRIALHEGFPQKSLSDAKKFYK